MKLVYIIICCLLAYSISKSEVLWEYTKIYDVNLMASEQIKNLRIENGNISFINNYGHTLQRNFELITLSENGELLNAVSPSYIPFSQAKNWVRIGEKIRVYTLIVPLSDTSKYGYCDYDLNGNRLDSVFYTMGGLDTNFRQYIDIKDEQLIIQKTILGKNMQLIAYCDFDLNEQKVIEIEQIEDTTINNNWYSIAYEPISESYIKIHYKKGQISSLNSTLAYISKHDKDGKFLWKHKIENTDYDSTQITDLAVFDDGSFAAFGIAKKYKDINDYIVVKFDKDNNLISEATIKRDEDIKNELLYNYVDKNNFYAVGQKIADDFKSSQFYIKRWDFSGNLTGEYTWKYGRQNSIYRIHPLQNDEMYVGGKVGNDTLYFAKIKFLPTSVNDNIKFDNSLAIFPNPASDFINISIDKDVDLFTREVQILDLLGLVVSKSELTDGNNRIDISNLPLGTYFIKVGDKVEKFVKM